MGLLTGRGEERGGGERERERETEVFPEDVSFSPFVLEHLSTSTLRTELTRHQTEDAVKGTELSVTLQA